MQIGPPTGGDGPKQSRIGRRSVLRRRAGVRRSGAGATFGHELIELRLVLRHPQAGQEVLKLALLLFQALQGVLAILVKRAVAASRRRPPRSRVPQLVA